MTKVQESNVYLCIINKKNQEILCIYQNKKKGSGRKKNKKKGGGEEKSVHST